MIVNIAMKKITPFVAIAMMLGSTAALTAEEIKLDFTQRTIQKEEIVNFAALEINDMVSKLRNDYGVKVVFVAKTHPTIKPDPKINTENPKDDRSVVQYYSSNGDIKALFEDYSALFIRPFHHFKHNTGEVDRPYFTEPILLLAPFVAKNTMIHEFIHILAYRVALSQREAQLVIENGSHSAQCGRLLQFLKSYGAKSDAQIAYDDAKKAMASSEEASSADAQARLLELKNTATQTMLAHYLYNLHYIVESTGEELDTYITLYGYATSNQWTQSELKTISTKIESLTKELGGLLTPMDRDYSLKALKKDRATYPENIVHELTGVETYEGILRKRHATLLEWVTQEKTKYSSQK